MAGALGGGAFMTREELGRVLEEGGIDISTPQRLPHILMHAELDGIICSGPKRGKQFTYALLDERAPRGPALGREEAVVELVSRYFASHGPATVHDFAWWSGLTTSDARAGLRALGDRMVGEGIEGKEYWLPRDSSPAPEMEPAVHLLPAFDEYTVAYADRRNLLLAEHSPQSSEVMLGPVVVEDGYVVGRWRRGLNRGSASIEANPFTIFDDVVIRGLAEAAARYGEWLGTPAALA
jgi:hypothetical protein